MNTYILEGGKPWFMLAAFTDAADAIHCAEVLRDYTANCPQPPEANVAKDVYEQYLIDLDAWRMAHPAGADGELAYRYRVTQIAHYDQLPTGKLPQPKKPLYSYTVDKR
tara:strand:- start:4886 stop:5212 length:327 start_codon:yes stop_codon:yes gene_type:complete